ncbi:hypothetical protein JZ751_014676 [Albula glossodonta]|uniref:Uncharacterized protein n=1 Tax=Albula glossodonta TaxID=121402 RepID=A0A8T2N414_9TELE|nr:hypothetical protein JZ751_014676 [Albula glossodonta]
MRQTVAVGVIKNVEKKTSGAGKITKQRQQHLQHHRPNGHTHTCACNTLYVNDWMLTIKVQWKFFKRKSMPLHL